MVERAQAKRALERLVVHRDKFKSGAKSLKSTQRGVNGMEIMKTLLDEDEVAASCTAGKTAGLEQEVLDRIMDRTNVEHFKEKMKLVNGKTPEEMLKEMEAEEMESMKGKTGCKDKVKGKKKGKHRTKTKFRQYYRTKQEEFEFECPKCQLGFHSEPELTLHKAVHAGLIFKPFKCEHCGKGCTTPDGLKQHIKKHHPEHTEHKYKCKFCDKVFNHLGHLNNHTRIDHPEEEFEFTCHKCQKEFHLEAELNLHKCLSHKLKPYKCKLCGKGCKNPEGVQTHVRRNHPEHAERKLQGYRYVLPVNYIRIDHLEDAGEDTEYKGMMFPETFSAHRFSVKSCRVDVPKQFECLEGPIKKYYNSKDGYYTVQTLSDSESEEEKVEKDLPKRAAPLDCKLCSYRATTKNEMHAHIMWKHREQPRPFITCSHCEYKSKSEFGMVAHMNLKHGPCLVCGYTPKPQDTFDCAVLHGGNASKKSTVMILDAARGQGQGPLGDEGRGGGVQRITIDSDSDEAEEKSTKKDTQTEALSYANSKCQTERSVDSKRNPHTT